MPLMKAQEIILYVHGNGSTFIIIIIFLKICVFNTLTWQSNASKQQQSAADNELLWVSSLALIAMILSSQPTHPCVYNDVKSIWKYDLYKMKTCECVCYSDKQKTTRNNVTSRRW